jgi:hypothetical protein
MAMGEIELSEGQTLNPGESADVFITFWLGQRMKGVILPGREWTIQEGEQVVGHGEVLDVLS